MFSAKRRCITLQQLNSEAVRSTFCTIARRRYAMLWLKMTETSIWVIENLSVRKIRL